VGEGDNSCVDTPCNWGYLSKRRRLRSHQVCVPLSFFLQPKQSSK